MISAARARELLKEAVRAVDRTEQVALEDACGRVLAQTVVADRDFPPTDRSAMDGFAVRAADAAVPGAVLRVAGEIRAGQPLESAPKVEAGSAVRILTGAIVPPGADAVVMIELTEEASGGVRILEAVEPGQHVRRRAEELPTGAMVVAPGVELRPAEIAALAAVGCARVTVLARPRVGVLATGDEIVAVDRVPADHEVRNSNGAGVAAQLEAWGLEAVRLGIAPDDREGLRRALGLGLEFDGLVVTGGVSVGSYDLVAPQLATLGVDVLYHGVAMRPGKPALAARRGRTVVVGLPGNPVSSFTTLVVLAAPALRKLRGLETVEGAALRATLDAPLRPRPGRESFALATVRRTAVGLVATPVKSAGSGDVLALVRGNAFAVAPAGTHALPPGTNVEVIPYDGGLGAW